MASTDPLGHTTTYTYDALGQMTSSSTPLGNTTTYTYDSVGNQTSETDPLLHTTTYLYDAAGQHEGWAKTMARATAPTLATTART